MAHPRFQSDTDASFWRRCVVKLSATRELSDAITEADRVLGAFQGRSFPSGGVDAWQDIFVARLKDNEDVEALAKAADEFLSAYRARSEASVIKTVATASADIKRG